jgi:hypothetical protein
MKSINFKKMKVEMSFSFQTMSAKEYLLTEQQLNQFKDQGFLVVKEFFSKEELQTVKVLFLPHY